VLALRLHRRPCLPRRLLVGGRHPLLALLARRQRLAQQTMTRRRRKIPTCHDCGAGVTWITVRGNRVPFGRLPIDLDDAIPAVVALAMPYYSGEAWAIDDLVLELQAQFHYSPGQARAYARERCPWHVPHVCPVAHPEAVS
jgi:hypothetical protein